jgi:DNA invertase Pin-like site-specific DNA recombinase
MSTGKFVAYYRVSTARQGASGLGLDAQRKSVEDYLNGGDWKLLAEFTEIESGNHNGRPKLQAAIHHAKVTGARLVVAKLDRLSRNAAFLLTLRDSNVDFVAADMPEANRLTVGIMALVAEQEREAISRRTREALAAAKARGVKLGCPNGAEPLRRAGKGNAAAVDAIKARADSFAADLAEIVRPMRAAGASYPTIAARLEARGYRTPRDGRWHPPTVARLVARLEAQ